VNRWINNNSLNCCRSRCRRCILRSRFRCAEGERRRPKSDDNQAMYTAPTCRVPWGAPSNVPTTAAAAAAAALDSTVTRPTLSSLSSLLLYPSAASSIKQLHQSTCWIRQPSYFPLVFYLGLQYNTIFFYYSRRQTAAKVTYKSTIV